MLAQRLSGLVFCALFLAYGMLAQDIPLDLWADQERFNARTFPFLIAIGGGIVSLLYALFPARHDDQAPLPRGHWVQAGLLVMLMLAYGYLLEPMGFIPATSLLLLGGFLLLGARKPLPLITIPLGVTVGFYYLTQWLGIFLEAGL